MNNSANTLSDTVQQELKYNWNIFGFAILIVSMGQLSLGLIFPLLPWIGLQFSLDQTLSDNVIVTYLVGYGLSQLCYGPISCLLGRKKTLLFGLSISIIGLGIILVFHDDFAILLLGRFIQGLGGGCESVLARSMIHDTYKGKSFLSAMTGLSIFSAFIPIFSPILGGLVNHNFGWVAVFICIFSYTLLGYILLILKLPETLENKQKHISVISIVHYYIALLRDRYFLSYAVIGWINWALVVFALASAPFVIESQLKISSEHYSYWTIIPAIAFMCSSILCFLLRRSFGTHHIVFIAPIIQIIVSAIFLFFPFNIINITIGFVGLAVAQALVYPCSQALLLVPYSNKMGTVSALSGGGQMISASIFLLIFWDVHIDNFYYLSLIILIVSIIGLNFARLGKKSIAVAKFENQ
ncbi:MFS transporter [Photobacterium damselae]|uniref:MFS transporter n=1 Tax=Photobacterium damselae subsp. damselae TaxID=85581 RepID=A0A850QX68_PHODD|nr:MFS transporter [Photobacterium damselae]NVP01220.1 MFS transporter [Photobacterium damselae subsp. damselae]USR76819.1 MFS transporter [Photobacterium damselae]